MEGGVVHDDHLPWLQERQQLVLEPPLEQSGVAGAAEGGGRQHLHLRLAAGASAPDGNHRDALFGVPAPLAKAALPTRAPAKEAAQGVLGPSLVEVDPLLGRSALDLPEPGFSLRGAPLDEEEEEALFLRVWPSRASAVENVVGLTLAPPAWCHAWAISSSVRSGCSCTNARNAPATSASFATLSFGLGPRL